MNSFSKMLLLVMGMMVAIVVVGLTGCGEDQKQRFEAGGYTLEAMPDPNPPIVGENRLEMELLGADGAPVTDADVSVRAFMPAMGAMPAMEVKGRAEARGKGKYAADFSLSMSGNWDLTVTAEKSGAELARFSMQIAPTRPGLIDTGAGMESGMAGHRHGAAPAGAPAPGSELVVSEPRRQLIGVRTGVVEKKELSRPIRTVGRVEEDETRLWHVTLKYSGWIEKLFVDFTGAFVDKGQPLFTLYSQELYVSQQEYLDALEAYQSGQASKSLVDAARERLSLWDITDAQVADLVKRGRSSKYLTVYSPARGYVVNKMATEGHEVKPGMRLYEIADLSKVWVIADVYEYEASLVKVGNEAWVSDPYASGAPRKGVVDYIYPNVDVRSRTLPIRLVFENPDLSLKPGMFVNVRIESPLGERVAVPEQAVLYSGEHRYVFVDLGQGRLDPRQIFVGDKSENYYTVTSGLSAGERVVTSANFLLSSEAQLKGALPKWKGADASDVEKLQDKTGDSSVQKTHDEHEVHSPPAMSSPEEELSEEKERRATPQTDRGHERNMHKGHGR